MRHSSRIRSFRMVAAGALLLAAAANASEPIPQQASSPTRPPYVIRAGDELTLKVFNHPELEETLQVRPDGKISVLLLDEVDADGLTVADLDDVLTAGYSMFIREPQVSVIVRSFSHHKVYVGGEVANPGAIELSGDLTALAVVIRAGGFKTTASTDSVILLRNDGKGNPIVAKLDLKAVVNDGELDVVLQPYDVVFVPMSGIAKVDKFVDQYMRQLLPISLNAGFTYLLSGSAVVIP